MNCAELDIPLCEYVDGTLDAATRAAVERHLAGCPVVAAAPARDHRRRVGRRHSPSVRALQVR